MNTLYFWKSWHRQSRLFYFFLLGLLAAVLLWYGVSFFASPSPTLRWELVSDVDKVPVTVGTFQVGVFDFSYTADQYVVSETYRGSNIQINPWVVYALLCLTGVSLTVLLVIISTLKQFWYYFAILIFTGILAGFKLEQLLLFGSGDKLGLAIALLLYLPATYYFHSIRPYLGLWPRVLTFAVLTLIFGLLIALFSEAAHPALVLVSYGMVVPVVLSIFFMVLVGHEIISFFLVLVTRSNTPHSKHSFLHFSVLSVVYLGNVVLLYLKNTGILRWDILYLNAFFLLPVAALLGIWGFRQREVQYQQIFRFDPLGAYFYMALAIITLSTCSYFFTTANDPVIEALEDVIVYSQIGYGLLFFLYIIANFVQPLMDNQRVSRIMYKPPTFPYGTAQIVGTVAMVAFLLNAGMFPFYQGVAGYYNGIGDLYWYQAESFTAEQYYKLGDQYGYNNHRSNYALGTLARLQNDEGLASFYFKEALTKNPTPYAAVNLSNSLRKSQQFFNALFSLRRGMHPFEESPYLKNNLAILYGRTSVTDSALTYLQAAMQSPATRQAAEANTLSVLARANNDLQFSVDTLLRETVTGKNYIQNQINTLVLLNQHPQETGVAETFDWNFPQDSVLNSFSFAYLYNYLFYKKAETDTTLLRQVAALIEQPENGNFYEPLSYALAFAAYETNRVVDAFKSLDYLQASNSFKTGYYNHVLGLWALQQQAPAMAARYFAKSAEASYPDAAFRQAISLTEAAATSREVSREDATHAWQALEKDTTMTVGIRTVAQDMQQVLSDGKLAQYAEEKDDAFRYQVVRYRAASLEEKMLEKVFQSFSENSYKALALHDLMQRYPALAGSWLETQISTLQNQQETLTAVGRQYLDWILTLQQQRTQPETLTASQVADLPELSIWHRYKKHYLLAAIARRAQQTAEASTHYDHLVHNPFYEEGFLAALQFRFPEESSIEAYQLLLDAIQSNPYSTALLKAYIRVSLANGLQSYAGEALEELEKVLPPKEFAQFKETYAKLVASDIPEF